MAEVAMLTILRLRSSHSLSLPNWQTPNLKEMLELPLHKISISPAEVMSRGPSSQPSLVRSNASARRFSAFLNPDELARFVKRFSADFQIAEIGMGVFLLRRWEYALVAKDAGSREAEYVLRNPPVTA